MYGKIFFYYGFLWGIASLLLLLTAWRAAASKKIPLHRTIMVVLTIGGWLFVLLYLLRYRIEDEAALRVPAHLVPWLAVHGSTALAAIAGATALVWARLEKGSVDGMGFSGHLNSFHRLYGRIVLVLWTFTHIGGIANFYVFGF